MTTTELQDKRKKLAEQAGDILLKAQDEGRECNTSEDSEWHKIHDEIDKLGKQLEMRTRQEAIEKQLAEPEARRVPPEPMRPSEPLAERNGQDRSSLRAIDRLQRSQGDASRALRLWLLGARTAQYAYTNDDLKFLERMNLNPGFSTLEINFSTMSMRTLNREDQRGWQNQAPLWDMPEVRAQGVASGAAGLFTVPDELMRSLEIALLTYGGMRARCTILRTATGADLPIPTVNDTTNSGALLAENTQVANQDVAFGQVVLQSFKYSSKQVLVSVELLQDNAVNLPGLLGELLGTRIGRITNLHFTTGTGTGQPNGIVTAAATGVTQAGGQTPSLATSVTYANLVELEHSVDPAYRGNAAFMMHDGSIKKIKQLLDTTGRPIWAPGIAGTAPDTLLGYPVVVNQDMAQMTANAKSIIFGDLSKYFIRDVLGVQLMRLDERYADFHQVAFLAYARMDGDLINAGTNPVKLLVNAAT